MIGPHVTDLIAEGALALGLVSGLVASQCATPVLAAILTYVMAQQGALVYGAVLLFLYAPGRGVPILHTRRGDYRANRNRW